MTFQDDGKIKAIGDVETEYIPYRIDGNTLYSTEDGEEKIHTLLEWTDKYIKFTSKEDYDDGTFYFSEADARANPQSDCGGDGETPANGITSGKVVFKDENGNTISVPNDAYIRITPEENQVEGSWNGLRCKIQSDGSFGNQECFIYGNYDDMKTLFDTSNSFQVVVFKNHIEPDEPNWNCGEDVYKYVGEGGASLWQNIEVTPSDYQDRSDETCNG